jgi:prolyl-tRNA synthetase
MQGVPVRLALGVRDIENNVVEVARRDTKTKETVPLEGIAIRIENLLDAIQKNMFEKALAYRDAHITEVNTWEAFMEVLDNKGGFVSAHWDGSAETEDKIKELSKATIRCIPLNNRLEAGTCILTGKPSTQRVLFARAY